MQAPSGLCLHRPPSTRIDKNSDYAPQESGARVEVTVTAATPPAGVCCAHMCCVHSRSCPRADTAAVIIPSRNQSQGNPLDLQLHLGSIGAYTTATWCRGSAPGVRGSMGTGSSGHTLKMGAKAMTSGPGAWVGFGIGLGLAASGWGVEGGAASHMPDVGAPPRCDQRAYARGAQWMG